MYSEDDIYEVISSVKNISTKLFKINSFFLRSSPIRELISMIQKIKKYINNNCKKVSYIKNVKYNITAMDTIDELNRINDEDNNISISNLLQATNLKSQVIGIVFNIKTNNIDEKIFLPTYPSKINKEYPFSFLSEMGFNLPSPSYDILKNTLLVLKNAKAMLMLNYISYIVEDSKIVGINTETNQFIPIKPLNISDITEYDLTDLEGKPINKIEFNTYNDDNIYNEYNLDDFLLLNENKDETRKKEIINIKLESVFYKAFLNLFRIVINKEYKAC